MKEITVVTGFFNINRENWKSFDRSAELYFDYFTQWAKLKNKIIVYVENKELKQKIIDFRESLGDGYETKVIVINDYKKIDEKLYDSIYEVTNNKIQR